MGFRKETSQRVTFVAAICLLVARGVTAQVYETTDAEGNTVFTDTPTAEAKEVELHQSNIADAPPDIPKIEPEADPPTDRGSKAPGESIQVAPNNYDDQWEDELVGERRRELMEAKKQQEGDGAEPRRGIREAAPGPGVHGGGRR